MADLIAALNRVVKQSNPTQGKVLSVSGELVTVSTSDGVKAVSNSTSKKLSAGDTIQINGGIATGVLQPSRDIPTYHV